MVRKELSNSQTVKDLSFYLEFDDQISLAVPRGGEVVENGWKLTPLYNPVVCSQMRMHAQNKNAPY